MVGIGTTLTNMQLAKVNFVFKLLFKKANQSANFNYIRNTHFAAKLKYNHPSNKPRAKVQTSEQCCWCMCVHSYRS